MKLTQQQIQTYETQGLVIVRNLFSDDDLQPVINELMAEIDARANALHAAGKIEHMHQEAPFTQRYGLLFGQCQEVGEDFDIMYYRGRAIFDFLHHPKLLDAAGGLVGPNITCSPIHHLRAKPPETVEPYVGPSFHNAPWHQDAAGMMAEAEDSNVVTCWIPLGDAKVEMGCMQAIPGAIDNGYLRHLEEGGTVIDPQIMPQQEPLTLACLKGDVVFLNRFTPHRSTRNKSDKCRWSLDLRYQTTGHHTGRTAHPEFIVRAPDDPSSVMDDYDTWCRLWIDAFENPRGFAGHRFE
ncbi:MAG: phytanoyl-CoA dioxygenase family protein [Chloroflexota bacterium]